MPDDADKVPTVNRDADKIRRDVDKAGGPGSGGGGTVFTEPVLVVSQKAKIIEINNEYAIFDQSGKQIGAVRQVGQSKARKVLRVLTSVDQFLTTKLEVVDIQGKVLLALTRPAKIMKSKVVVSDGAGKEIGVITQRNMIGKIRFSLDVGGQSLGSINAENWRAWNFNIQDANGTEIARIKKTFEGLAKTMFTTADNYVVSIPGQIHDPLRSLVVAAALSVDTALKQDSRGLS
ncbi:MAG: scramblase [Actinobacteria bacterium]|nr:scramblase [Actinomycetota bacterium]